MKSAILYLYGPWRGIGCCRIMHARHLALTSVIYTLVRFFSLPFDSQFYSITFVQLAWFGCGAHLVEWRSVCSISEFCLSHGIMEMIMKARERISCASLSPYGCVCVYVCDDDDVWHLFEFIWKCLVMFYLSHWCLPPAAKTARTQNV